jgi:pfkB family carbohydrate kinase
VPKVGVIGSLVWDLIHGRDPLAPPTEEWGGIAYALGGLDASLPPDWQIVPLIKVGRDLAPEAAELLKGLTRLAPGARCVEVPAPNNRVVLHYQSAERRCERMSGGVPGWTWLELGPMVMDLDAIYLNFISGFELTLGTAQALRQGFHGPIYADLHSLFLGMHHDGIRVLQPLADPAAWFGCFDAVQLNEDEMRQLSPDPLSLSAQALGAGTSLLVVTLGPKGAAYVAAPGFDGWGTAPGVTLSEAKGASPGAWPLRFAQGDSGAVRTALVPAPPVEALDPTGCGDVFGAAACARLLAGDSVEGALAHATALAGRNAGLRGAGGLGRHLRGELLVP